MPLPLPPKETVIHDATGPIAFMPPAVPGGTPIPQTIGPIDKDAYPNGIEVIVKHTTYRREFFPVEGVSDGVTVSFNLKDMAPAGVLIGQSLPDNYMSGTPVSQQWNDQNIPANCHLVSFSNLDKPSTFYVLTSGKVTSVNMAKGNLVRSLAKGTAAHYRHIHSTPWWHNGHNAAQNWTAADWKQQLDVGINGMIDGLDAGGYLAEVLSFDVVNETIDDGNQTPLTANGAQPFVRQSKLTVAAKADTSWVTEMAQYGLTAQEAGDMGWLYALRRAHEATLAKGRADILLSKPDYSISEGHTVSGYGVAPTGFSAQPHQLQREERYWHELQRALQVKKAGYPMRLDAVNFQGHVKAYQTLDPAIVRARQERANLLSMPVLIGEITLEEDTNTLPGILAAIGITAKNAAWDRYMTNYLAIHLREILLSTADLRLLQAWTDVGAVGEQAISPYDPAGKPTVAYRAMQKAFQGLTGRTGVRAATTQLSKSIPAFRPYDIVFTTLGGGGAFGVQGTGIKLPWSHYQRRVTRNSEIENMDPQRYEMNWTVRQSGAAAAHVGVLMGGLEGATHTFAWFEWAANHGIVLKLQSVKDGPIQTVAIGTVAKDAVARVGLRYAEGKVLATACGYTPAGGVTEFAPTALLDAVLPDPTFIRLHEGPSGVTTGTMRHKIWDVTHLSPDVATMLTRTRVSARTGQPMTAQEIYDWQGA